MKILDKKYDFFSKTLLTLLIPKVLFFLYFQEMLSLSWLKFCLALFIFFSFIMPIFFRFNDCFQRNVIFLNCINFPRFAKFKHPRKHGINGTRNFYFQIDNNITLGVWHVLPETLIKENLPPEEEEEEYYVKTLSYDIPVFVYMHGNSSNRAAGHHIELYKKLRHHGHVFTYDYRGYGDSNGIPYTEKMVVDDSLTILRWIKQRTTAPIFVWGHSLGTGIATHVLRTLKEKEDVFVRGLILESPFNNMRNEISEHPMTLIFRHLPWYERFVVDTLCDKGFLFSSDEHINYINCPVLILHAEDDWIVPYRLGYKLYCSASKTRNSHQGPIQFQGFPKHYGCGHKYICKAPKLPNLISNFINQCLSRSY